MTSYLKKRFYEYREGKHQAPSFNSFYDMNTNTISKPMENSFLHVNGTSPDIIDRSKTIVTLRSQPLEDEPDCIIVSNSRFYGTVKEQDLETKTDNGVEKTLSNGITNDNIDPSLVNISFRDTSLRRPARGISIDSGGLSSDLDSPDVDFNHCKLNLQQSVAEKYKLGELVEEMDDRFFDMTEEEKSFQVANHSNNPIDLSNVPMGVVLPSENKVHEIRILRTPPPPPKPLRKNSQKRIEQIIDSDKGTNEYSDLE